MKELKDMKITILELDGLDFKDYPDFVDAYAISACYEDGTDLTEEELDTLNNDHQELIYQAVFAKLY